MPYKISKVAVIGAGTMGAAIAAHAANAGLEAVLLDIVPFKLTPDEEVKGLTLQHPAVRNRIVNEGWTRLMKSKPAAIMSSRLESLVTLGNLDDNLDKLKDADIIIEAIIERLDLKQSLMEKLEKVRKPGSIIATNTSGIPIASIAAGRSDEFKAHVIGTHFFNPPRYMKLLELIPTPDTSQAVIEASALFVGEALGKGVVYCKDTPNFIGNRLFSIDNCFAVHYGLENGYSVSEIDALTGPLMGRPKTATLRLIDLVGVDVAGHVFKNLYPLIPNDPHRDVLQSPKLLNIVEGLVKRGWLGNKTGQGVYKKGKDEKGEAAYFTLNPATFEYEPSPKVKFDAVEKVSAERDLGKRLTALFSDEHKADRGAQYVWALLSYELAYAAATAQEIAHDIKSIDEAMRWGFGHEAGPFEIWDKLGVSATIEKMEASGRQVAQWVKDMIVKGCPTFYRTENGAVTGYYDWNKQAYVNLPVDPKAITCDALHRAGKELERNDSASLLDMGDGVLLLEFHSKMNSIDPEMIGLMMKAKELLDTKDEWKGLVIGNDGNHFCAGANLFIIAYAAENKMYDDIKEIVKMLQDAMMAFRYSRKPVVTASHQLAIGGGCEVMLGGSRRVATGENYVGLVEVGVGVIPAGGGSTAMVRNVISKGMKVKDADPLPLFQKVFETLGMGKVATSAHEAYDCGFLGEGDRVILNRDHLLYEAKQEALAMSATGYVPPVREKLYAAGRDMFAALRAALYNMHAGGYISEYDRFVGEKLAYVLTGGDLSAAQWVDEDYFLQLEREAFIELVKQQKTIDRINYMLNKGKPLRN